MAKEDWKDFKEKLEEINEELTLKLGKKGLPDWQLWFKKGKKPICGVQLFRYLKLNPKEKEKYIKKCARALRNFIHGKNLGDVKSGVEEVFNKLIYDHEAIGGVLHLGSAYFWERLEALVTKALMAIPVQDNHRIDERTGEIIEETLIKSDAEDEMNEAIDKDRFLKNLREPDRSIVELKIKGYEEREIAEKVTIQTGKKVSQSTVNRIWRKLLRQ